MAITKQTVLEERTITESGIVLLKWRKEIVEDGVVIASRNHRCSVEPGMDVEKVIKAVNDDIVNNYAGAAMPKAAADKIRETVEAEHTPKVVKAFKDKRKAEMDAAIAAQKPVAGAGS